MPLDPEDRVYADNARGTNYAMCQWFAKCRNAANGLRPHPILGPVPICKRCDDWYERMES